MTRKYVDFISDDNFLECVKWVCDAYPDDPIVVDMGELQRNTLDPFKMLFDIGNMDSSMEDWIKSENIRQHDKTINNRIGEFHQKLLGKVSGWEDLGVGDDSRVDLRKADNSIFIELKNKFNTMNSDATKECRHKLETAIRRYPRSTGYWAYVISRDGSSGSSDWVFEGRNNGRIKKIWGAEVYTLVTGDSEALAKVWRALPTAIADLRETESHINMGKLTEFFNSAFNQ